MAFPKLKLAAAWGYLAARAINLAISIFFISTMVSVCGVSDILK